MCLRCTEWSVCCEEMGVAFASPLNNGSTTERHKKWFMLCNCHWVVIFTEYFAHSMKLLWLFFFSPLSLGVSSVAARCRTSIDKIEFLTIQNIVYVFQPLNLTGIRSHVNKTHKIFSYSLATLAERIFRFNIDVERNNATIQIDAQFPCSFNASFNF